MQKVSGIFTASAALIDIDLGFIPSHFRAWSALAGTILTYEWYKAIYDAYIAGTGTIDCAYGMVDAAAGKTSLETAASGIKPYNTQVSGVKIPSPKGITIATPDGYTKVPAGAAAAAAATISDWSAAVNYASGGQDRSATVVGTVVRPPIHNGRVFELITGVAAGATEPSTWDVPVGQTVTDGGSNIFLCREEILCTIGGKGVELGVDICTDGELWVYEAELHDQVEDKGDADLISPI